jgi:hypothetical protein
MDAPFSMDKKQEMSKGERETGPTTKSILNPLKVLWKDFAEGGKDSFGEKTRNGSNATNCSLAFCDHPRLTRRNSGYVTSE